VIFYVFASNKFEIERILNTNLAQFESRFQIKAIAIEPNLYNNYVCPIGKKNFIFIRKLLKYLCEFIMDTY
jgi:hypothetical protein